jgi:hypothetical protein
MDAARARTPVFFMRKAEREMRNSAQKAAAKERYLKDLEEFQAWCAVHSLPFRWAMSHAMQLYRDLYDPAIEEEVGDEPHP